MEDLAKKIEQIVDLVKAMMASIKQPALGAGDNRLRMPKTPSMGIKPPSTGIAPQSKKDPVKVAEQLAAPEEKTPAIKEAKQLKETFKVAKNGQWQID